MSPSLKQRTSRRIDRTGTLVLITAITAALLIGLWLLIDPLAFNRVYRITEVLWLPTAMVVLVGGLGMLASVVMTRARTLNPKSRGDDTVVWPTVTGITVGLLGAVAVMILRSYSAAAVYADIPESTEDQLSFAERVPYSVANNSARSAMEGVNADLGITVYLTGTNSYGTPADERTFLDFGGYEAVVEQNFDLDGSFLGTDQCGFSDQANRRIGGSFGNSLQRAIAAENRTVIFSSNDAWAWCDEDTAMVAVPLDKRAGHPLNRHIVPAGVAVYDGSTGEVEILEEVETDQLPGPVVSESYASRVESAMDMRDREGVMSVLLGQTGYQTPDASSVNHQLGLEDGGSAHVTALQRRSGSTAVEYILAVPSGEVTAGEHPETTMALLDPTRRDNEIITDAVRSQFSDINWDSGIEVLEITPGPDGTWIASIGQSTDVVYRVSMDGNEPSTWTIRDMRTGSEEEVDEADISDPEDQSDTEPITGEDVSELSDEQLVRLIREAAEEIESRTDQEGD